MTERSIPDIAEHFGVMLFMIFMVNLIFLIYGIKWKNGSAMLNLLKVKTNCLV